MKKLIITAYPYAVTYGELIVPDDLPEDEYQEYTNEHFNDVSFGAPDLDYCGTDFDVEED